MEEGTNREKMRSLLSRAQNLQNFAFDNGLNMCIGTRLKEEEDRPWFTGHVYVEDAEFTNEEENGVKYLFFSVYEWRSFLENVKELDAVDDFITNHKK